MMQPQMTEIDEPMPETLKQAWQEMRATNPQLRIREAAATLGVSEAELLATGCGNGVTRLVADWPSLLSKLAAWDSLMALTRTDFAVHEKTGMYQRFNLCGEHLLISGHNIQLCLMLRQWYAGFAVTEETYAGTRYSLQFFAADGEALQKIYLVGQEHLPHYYRLIEAFQANDQSPHLHLPVSVPQSDSYAADELSPHWQRLLACNTPSGKHPSVMTTVSIEISQFRQLMHQLAQMLLPIEIAVCNKGAIQVHEGLIQNLRLTGPWFNVLDARFNLHLNETAIERMEVVSVACRQHPLTGLILRGKQGQTIATIFGQNDEATGESPVWRDFVSTLPNTAYSR